MILDGSRETCFALKSIRDVKRCLLLLFGTCGARTYRPAEVLDVIMLLRHGLAFRFTAQGKRACVYAHN